jgi:hypothetical protein
LPSSPQRPSRVEQKRSVKEHVADMRREQERRERRQRNLIYTATAVVVALIAAGTAWAVVQERRNEPPPAALPDVVADGRRDLPPWPVPADPVPLAEQAGLRVAPMEQVAHHFHAHVDVIVDGDPVTVPANIGIHPAGTAMSELHTHDERGVLHIEAPNDEARYTLGQVFAEWDVRLDKRGIGGLDVDGSNTLRAYVDGELATGDPADIELTPDRQIALVYGPADAEIDIPDSYEFQPGE